MSRQPCLPRFLSRFPLRFQLTRPGSRPCSRSSNGPSGTFTDGYVSWVCICSGPSLWVPFGLRFTPSRWLTHNRLPVLPWLSRLLSQVARARCCWHSYAVFPEELNGKLEKLQFSHTQYGNTEHRVEKIFKAIDIQPSTLLSWIRCCPSEVVFLHGPDRAFEEILSTSVACSLNSSTGPTCSVLSACVQVLRRMPAPGRMRRRIS